MNLSRRALYGSLAIAALISPDLAAGPRAFAAQSEAATANVQVTATVHPGTPQVGDNTIDLVITDGSGKPVSGLKLTARVAITTMDMGTARPAVKNLGNGHYRVGAKFSMNGPWRVTVSAGAAPSALDFEAGARTSWKPQIISLAIPAGSAASAAPATSSHGMPAMPGMTMPNAPAAAENATSAPLRADSSHGPGYAPDGPGGGASDEMAGMPGMKMGNSPSGMEEMTPLKMPQLKEESSYTVTGNENWKVRTGFGKNAGMVGMMTQMMVGGSGMEGMKMPAMTMTFDNANYTEGPDDQTATAAKPETSMPGMDMSSGMKMGSEPQAQKPPATGAAQTHEVMPAIPEGNTSGATAPGTPTAPMPVRPADAPSRRVPGTDMASKPKAVPLTIAASIATPKSGDNAITITLTDSQGAPVTGAKITASVAMTSMDMGTSHPDVKEIGAGKYRATATFSMAGPWRVVVKVTPSGGTPQKASFDFNAK